jgi:hypothetical protein
MDWQELVKLSEGALARYDVAAVNLACADGLPGADRIDRAGCLRKLEDMAEKVRWKTGKAMRNFDRNPENWDNSRNIFRIHCLVSVLNEDFGVRYNLAKLPVDVPLHTADMFIHGALMGDGGTCATLPVVYNAVGRRLGYPLKLVAAMGQQFGHLFCRWDEPGGERFNIEANQQGFSSFPDQHYREGIFQPSPELEAAGCFLKSMTRREELSDFLAQRACRWRDVGNLRQCCQSFAWSSAVAPHSPLRLKGLEIVVNEWREKLWKMMPKNFPALVIELPSRRYPPTLSENIEEGLMRLESAENLLRDPINEASLWGPMRQGLHLARRPTHIRIRYKPDGSSSVEHRFEPLPN